MANTARNSFRATALGLAALALGGALTTGGCSNDPAACESLYDYFSTQVWPVIGTKCMPCHNPQGLARGTSYVLKGPAEAGFLEYDLGVFSDVASFQKNGTSQVLLKPTRQIPHEGGEVIQVDSAEYRAIDGFVQILNAGSSCQPKPAAHFTGVEMLDYAATLRKASLIVAGRLPTDAEIARVSGGNTAELEGVLAQMMTEEPFYDFLTRTYNDLFLTDFYLDNASDQIDGLPYANPNWTDAAPKDVLQQYGLADGDELRRFTDIGLAREPLALVSHVVREGRPFSEILTANYFMVTPLSAKSYGVDATFKNPHDPLEFAEAKLKDFPHAGVLTSAILLSRHPTTPTNRNRARARKTYLWFLGTNILATAEQPVDQTKVTALNPTRDDPTCTVCHANVDPIAGCFQAFDERGKYNPMPNWYPEMFPPGFAKQQLPLTSAPTGVQWLAQRIVADPRFALSVVFTMHKALTGHDVLVAPSDTSDPQYAGKFASYLAQADTFRQIADQFKASNYDLRVVIVKIIESPYFRAINSVPLDDDRRLRLAEVGRGQMLGPEQLHDKINAVLGLPWLDGGRGPELRARYRNPSDFGEYQLFYGGIDSDAVTTRINDPNGVMAAVTERMAVQMACRAVPYDFTRAKADRVIFPFVDVSGTSVDPMGLEPETDAGLPIELAQQGIRLAIVKLHKRILGETLSPDDPEVTRAFQLFVDTWREGRQGLKQKDKPLSPDLPYACRAEEDFYTGTKLADAKAITKDDKYVIRSWMAVVTYLLGDYKFLYE